MPVLLAFGVLSEVCFFTCPSVRVTSVDDVLSCSPHLVSEVELPCHVSKLVTSDDLSVSGMTSPHAPLTSSPSLPTPAPAVPDERLVMQIDNMTTATWAHGPNNSLQQQPHVQTVTR